MDFASHLIWTVACIAASRPDIVVVAVAVVVEDDVLVSHVQVDPVTGPVVGVAGRVVVNAMIDEAVVVVTVAAVVAVVVAEAAAVVATFLLGIALRAVMVTR